MLTESLPPKSDRIRRDVLENIRTGRFQPGSRLPSERSLARTYKVNTRTIRRSLEQLTEQGIIEKRPRVGYFVLDQNQAPAITRLAVVLPAFMQSMEAVESAMMPSGEDRTPPTDAGGVHPYTGCVVAGVSRAVDHQRFAVSTLFYDYDSDAFWNDIGQVAVAGGIKGIALRPVDELPREAVQRLIDAGIHVVLIAPRPAHLSGMGLISIGVDQSAPLVEAVAKLKGMGHERIAFARYEGSRHRHMLDALLPGIAEQFDPQWAKRFVVDIPERDRRLELSVLDTMFDAPAGPTAVIVQDEFLAWEVLRQCQRRGLNVPGDVSLVSLCNNAPAWFPVPLAAPDSSRLHAEGAAMAMDLLVRMVDGETVTGREIVLDAAINWTSSVAPVIN